MSNASARPARLASRLGLRAAAICIFALLLVEAVLRLAGYPRNRYGALAPQANGLYARNRDFIADWGPFPYRIQTDDHGFRGPALAAKSAGAVRIAMAGDSITDGFFVDDAETYPRRLEAELRARGRSVQVLNAARGAASIDKEAAIVRRLVAPLEPDVVVVTATTNDLYELAGKSPEDLLAGTAPLRGAGLSDWLVSRTALGEVTLSTWLKIAHHGRTGLDRNHIEANAEYEANARIFSERFAKTDGLALDSSRAARLLDGYFLVLRDLAAFCAARHTRLVVVYFPAYSEIYLKSASAMRERLNSECDRLGIPFLDLTDSLRAHDRTRPIHFAPVDFHPNAEGNAIMARALAQFLVDRQLVP